jgi:hypothetical protein
MPDVTFERFGGLNLIADPQEAGAQQAISCLNVALDRNGRVRIRDGYDTLYTAATENYVFGLHPVSTGLVLAATGKVRVVDLGAGTSAANVSLAANGGVSFATLNSATYFTDTTGTQIQKFVAPATFSSPAGLAAYKGNFLAVQPLEDRLVIADASSTSKLWFSDAATPETITAANNLQLTPGDGQRITGMCVFGTELFVFKRTKFFVFSGNSTDSTGGSIFNYRMVDTGIGVDEGAFASTSAKLVATHSTGVYFIGADGIYRTTGGAPVKISDPIAPVFKGSNLPIPAPFSTVLASPVASWSHLGIAAGRLYAMGVSAAGAQLQFVMDLATGEWVVHDLAVTCMLDGSLVADTTDAGGYRGAAILGGRAGAGLDAVVLKLSDAFNSDDGTGITGHHQSGFYDLGSQHSKRVRRWTLWGSGAVNVSIFTDHGTVDANTALVTLGTGSAVARGWHNHSYRGVLFSHRIGFIGTSTVHRIGASVADERVTQ